MLRFLKRYKLPLTVLLTVLLPLVVYRANAVSPKEVNVLDRTVLLVTSPLARVLAWATGAVSDSWYQHVAVKDARGENAKLRRRLQKAERERDRLRTLDIENRHLRALLALKDDNPKMKQLPARVIGSGASLAARTLRIDQGALDGVKRGMPVIAGQGVVGLIQQTAWTTSAVLLIADEQVSCRARVVRTRAQGLVRGLGLSPGFELQLLEVLRFDDIEIGDRIETSGLGGVFPKGLPIGEVREVRVETEAQRRVAQIVPYVDFARLEKVMVVLSHREQVDDVVTPKPLRPPSLRAVSSSVAEAP